MSPAHAIALYLASQGVGTFAGGVSWSINVSREPAAPDDAVTLYDTAGLGLDTDDMDIDRPSIQVRSRSFNYPSAFAKQEQIRDLLLIKTGFVQSGVRYIVNQESGIMLIGRDENDRQILTANYSILAQVE